MFKASVTIGRIAGIPIRIHVSLLLGIPLLTWLFGMQVQYIADGRELALATNPYVLGGLLAVALFVSVGLHELAHSLVALRRGIEIRNITLMLFGGVAQLDEEFVRDPSNELAIASAGPIVSLLLGAGFMVLSYVAGSARPDIFLVFLLLGQLNIILAVFNLLPAFPTDGGRILRSLLAKRKSHLAATKIASSLGQAFAFLFGIYGLISGNFFLILIAVFVYQGASQEYQASLLRQTLSGFVVADLMSYPVSVVEENNTVQQLLEQMYRERHSGYPVVDYDGQVKGCVTMEDVQKVEPRLRDFTTVGQVMSCTMKTVNPDDDIYLALKEMSGADIGRLLVMDGDKLVGIITRSDILKGFRLRMMEENSGGGVA